MEQGISTLPRSILVSLPIKLRQMLRADPMVQLIPRFYYPTGGDTTITIPESISIKLVQS